MKKVEVVVLSTLIANQKLLIDYFDRIRDEYFTSPETIWVFQTVKKLFIENTPINRETIRHNLPGKIKLDAFFNQDNIQIKNLRSYFDIIVSTYIRGALKSLAIKTAEAVDDKTNDIHALVNQQIEVLMSLTHNSIEATPTNIAYVMNKAYEKTMRMYGYASNGITDGVSFVNEKVDEMTGGAKKGEIVFLASRPSIGKSTKALNIAVHNSIFNDKRGLIISPEMDKELYGQRIMCNLLEISLFKIRNGTLSSNDLAKMYAPHHCAKCNGTKIKYKIVSNEPIYQCKCGSDEVITVLQNYNINSKLNINDCASLNIYNLLSIIKGHKIQYSDLEYVILDHLQEVDYTSREDRRNRINTIIEKLRQVARELNIAEIILSQISRSAEDERGEKRPQLKHLKESGKIEEVGDLILLLYREGFYEQNVPPNTSEPLEIDIAKQRNGPIGTVVGKVNLGYQKIYKESFIGESKQKEDAFGKLS